MTLWKTIKFNCICGETGNFDYYGSVNVDVDPQLKQKVLNREINSFRCTKCGRVSELIAKFLYNDMENKIMVMTFPDNARKEKEKMINETSEEFKTQEMMIGKLNIKTYIVFGYDELFELLEKIKQ